LTTREHGDVFVKQMEEKQQEEEEKEKGKEPVVQETRSIERDLWSDFPDNDEDIG
jgi:hypothetical protein